MTQYEVVKEPLSAHPLETQLLVHRAEWWRNLRTFLRSWMAVLIQGEDAWRREAGNHIDWREGDVILSAEWPTVRPVDARQVAADRNQIVHAFAFNPSLTGDEKATLDKWLNEQLNRAYDVWLITNRALRAVGRLAGKTIPVIDLTGATAFICYEYVARGLIKTGRPAFSKINSALFGPPDVWKLAADHHLVYRGQLVLE